MALTDTKIRLQKPGVKPMRLYDTGGLYLEVSPTGGKLWRYKYRFGGKEKRLSLGKYPEVSLKDAREVHQEARKQLAKGIDPAEAKKIAKSTLSREYSFESIAREWIALKSPGWSPAHREKTVSILERMCFLLSGPKKLMN